MGLVAARPVHARYTSAGQGQCAAVWDDFDRPNAAVPGNAASGQAWTAHVGTWGANGSRLQCQTATGEDQIALGVAVADCEVAADIKVGGPDLHIGFLVRFVDTVNKFAVSISSELGNFHIARQVAGAWTTLASYVATIDQGRFYHLVVHATGPSIKVIVDGVEILSVSDTNHQNATRAGFVASGETGSIGDRTLARYDNFAVRSLR